MKSGELFYVFVAFEIGRRRLFPTENRLKVIKIMEIHICYRFVALDSAAGAFFRPKIV